MQTFRADTHTGRNYKDVFELEGVPAFREFYTFGVFIWKALYRGMYAPWHIVKAPTIRDANKKRNLFRMDTAKAISAELAGLVWGEQCEVNCTIDGRESTEDNPDPLNAFVNQVLADNAFHQKMQEHIEESIALGGGAIKTWADVREEGQPPKLMLGYAMADQFVPTAWDNAKATEGFFISRQAKNGYYYTRLEWHRWDGATYCIDNELYRADMQKGTGPDESQDILGYRYPLDALYPFLEEHTEIKYAKESLFAYYRTPVANNLDDNSPLGMSLYGNALDTLHAIDIIYDSFVREFRLGKKRIIVPARCISTVVDPTTGEVRRYFDPDDEAYEALNTDATDDELQIKENAVELRVEEHIGALNAFLSILCLQTGFSAGTFTFDLHEGLKTATEVISENSKTYKTVRTVQNQLRPAIEHVVRNIIDVAVAYGMEWEGQSIESLIAPGYHVQVTFDDGVTQDRQTNLNEGVMLVGAGLLSKYTFLTEAKYGQGLTPEQAEEELKRIAEERKTETTTVDLFQGLEP